MDTSFATLWEHVAQALPDRRAASQRGRSVTYAQLDEGAARLASAWAEAGVGNGSKVACYLFNCVEYLESVYAAFKLSAIPVNVNYRYQERELLQLLDDAGADVLVFHASLAERVAEAVRELPSLRMVVQVGVEQDPLPGAVPLDDLRATYGAVAPAERSGADELFMYTGGTTGMPKGVIWRHRDLFGSLAYQTYEVLGVEIPRDPAEAGRVARDVAEAGKSPTTLPVAPLMHATALFGSMATLLVGGTVVFAPGRSLDPPCVWETVEREGVTRMTIAGDAIARPLVEELEQAEARGRPYRIDTLESMVSSGVAWSDEVKAALLTRHPMLLLEILASSEGGPYAYASTTKLSDLPTRFLPTPGTKVFDERGEEVAPGSGRIGTLAFSGPMPVGYYRDPEKTARVFRTLHGRRYVMPGDLVTVAEDGSIVFLGRGATVINSGGEKVYPAEVEQALLSHAAVLDCAVVGTPDERWGETVTAVVVLSSTTPAAELQDHVGRQLAGYKKPRSVIVVDRLPRGPNGKVDLGAVRALASESRRLIGASDQTSR